VGSLYYLTPEQVQNKAYSGKCLDIWAAGVVLYTMLVGKYPFFSENCNEFLDLIQKTQYVVPSSISEEAKDLLKNILQVDPEKRIKSEQILEHVWCKGARRGPVLSISLYKLNIPLNTAWQILLEVLKEIEGLELKEIREKSYVLCSIGSIEMNIGHKTTISSDQETYFEILLTNGIKSQFKKISVKIKELCELKSKPS